MTCSQTVTWTEPTASDKCNGTLTYFSRSHAPGETFTNGKTNVYYVFKDAAGNTSTCTFSVTVVDNTPPVITSCPSPENRFSTDAGKCTKELGFTVNAADNCGIEEIIYLIDESIITFPHEFPKGTTTVTAIASDASGNEAECSFTVIVTDKEVPAITCPVLLSSYPADAGQCYSSLKFSALATDNCGIPDINYYVGNIEITMPYNFPTGTTNVTAVATDNSGNSSSCTFTVKVVNNVCVVYSGVLVASSTTSQVKIVLAATVTDTDNGCVTGVKVNFRQTGGDLINSEPILVGLVNPGDNSVGTASYEWTTKMTNGESAIFNIDIELDGDGYLIDPSECSEATGIPVIVYIP